MSKATKNTAKVSKAAKASPVAEAIVTAAPASADLQPLASTIVTAVAHGPAGAPRVTIFGQTASAVLRWAGTQNWECKHTFTLVQTLGLPITLITVRCQVGAGAAGEAGKRGPAAVLNTAQAAALTNLYAGIVAAHIATLQPRTPVSV